MSGGTLPRPGAASRARLAAPALVGLALLAAGCGYRLAGSPDGRFSSPSLAVDLRPFGNETRVPDAGAFLAARLREEMRRGGFRGAFRRAGADYLIEGTVREFTERVASKGTDEFGLEYRLTLLAGIRVVEVTRGKVLWKQEDLSETVSYFAGQDPQYTESNRRAAVEQLCRRMAARIGDALRLIL